VWDFWFADDGDRYHLYFLKASRALVDPDRRHPYHGYAAQVTDTPAGHPRWRIVTLTDAGKQVEVYAHTSQLEET